MAHRFKRLLTRGSVWNEKGESATYRATGLRDSTWNRNYVLMRPAELNSKVVEIAGDFEGAEACLALLETRQVQFSALSFAIKLLARPDASDKKNG